MGLSGGMNGTYIDLYPRILELFLEMRLQLILAQFIDLDPINHVHCYRYQGLLVKLFIGQKSEEGAVQQTRHIRVIMGPSVTDWILPVRFTWDSATLLVLGLLFHQRHPVPGGAG
jgi:hypothetical protein